MLLSCCRPSWSCSSAVSSAALALSTSTCVAVLRGGERGLAVDIAALEIDRLLPQFDELAQRLIVALEIGEVGA